MSEEENRHDSGFQEPFAEQTHQSLPSNTNKRSAPSCSVSKATMKRARMLMTSPAGSNAVHVLNILIPGIEFDHFDQSGPCHSPTYSTKITVNGLTYEGVGTNKKKARLAAAEKALEALLSDCNTISDPSTITETASDNSVTDNSHQTIAPKVPEPVGTSPVAILNEIRPCTEYFNVMNSEEESNAGAASVFRMGVMIDGNRFEGAGSSKKIARLHAAEAGLQKMFDLEFSHTSDGIPVFTGDESLWIHLKKTNKKSQKELMPPNISTPGGKHPVQLIYELFPDAVFSVGEKLSTDSSDVCSVSIRIEDTDFVGSGSNKKIARLNAAVEAINAFERDGTLERRMTEKRLHKMVKPKWQKPQRASFLQIGESPIDRPRNPYPQPLDAVSKLKEKFGNVNYEVVSETVAMDAEGTPAVKYFVLAMVLGRTFGGEGLSKEKAQLEAAEAAMNGLGLWTEEDENAKREVIRQENEQSRLTHLLYGKSRSRRTKRDWRLRGKSWVSGGRLESLPLILPQLSNSDAYRDFDERHGGSWYGCENVSGFDVQPLAEYVGRNESGFGMKSWNKPNRAGSSTDFETGYPEGYAEYLNDGIWQQNQLASNQDFYGYNGNFTGNDFGMYNQW